MSEPILRGYKHMATPHARDLIERGRLLLRPLSFYRNYEGGIRGVGDKFENSSIGKHSDLHIGDRASPADIQKAAAMGCRTDGSVADIHFVNNRTIYPGPDFHIFCLSTKGAPGLLDPGQAVVPIQDVKNFANALIAASNGLFKGAWFAPVVYRNLEFRVDDGHVRPSPFLKDPSFSYQSEIRIVMDPAQPEPKDMFLESEFIIRELQR